MSSLRRLACVLTVFCLAAPTAVASGFPWKSGDTPPQVHGIALGDTDQHVRELLGAPAHTGKMGPADVLDYPTLGLQFIATKDDGVSIIRLLTAGAATIDGIHVGDGAQSVVTKWGPPHQVQERTALYNAGTWTVTVRLADKAPKIIDLLLGWNTTKWPDFDPNKAQFYRPK